jgi:nitrate/nitrite transporter NarK
MERMIFELRFETKIMASKSSSSNPTTVLIIILLVLTFPLWLGLAGALFGVIIGIFGAAIGLVAGVFGAIGGIFGWMFNWDWPFGGLFHWNVIPILIIIAGVLLISQSRRR